MLVTVTVSCVRVWGHQWWIPQSIVHPDRIWLKCYTRTPTGRAWGHCSSGATVLSYPYKNLTSSHQFARSISGNIYL